MNTLRENGLHALCTVDSDAVTPVYRSQRGFASTAITRNGAGDYTLTLAEGIIQAQACILVTSNHSAGAVMLSAEWVSATTIRVRTLVSGGAGADTATDLDYSVAILDVGPA